MAQCLVTGANGFVGQHLCKKLEQLGHTVYKISRDLLDSYYLTEIISYNLGEPDWIFHLSAYGNHSHQQDVEETIKANIANTFYLLQKTNKFNYKAFINVSSSSTLLEYETFYSATKAAGERLAKAFSNEYKKPIISVRPSSITGIGDHLSHLIPTLIRSCLDNAEMPFVGYPTHDYIDINDVIDALILLAEKAEEHKGKIFNISNNKSHSNEEVRSIVEKETGKKANIKPKIFMRKYDNLNWKIDNTDLLKIGWKPKFSLEQSVAEMVASHV